MTIYTIYKATNTVNKKVYIGFTSSFHKRVHTHKKDYKKRITKFYSAIRKYGWENFQWEVLFQSTDKEYCLNIMEQHYIDQYNSIKEGYNLNFGGAGVLGAARDTIWITNGINNKRIKKSAPIPNNWKKGRTISITETKRKSDLDIGHKLGKRNKNKVSAYDLYENKSISIEREIFLSNRDRFCGITSSRIPAVVS